MDQDIGCDNKNQYTVHIQWVARHTALNDMGSSELHKVNQCFISEH